MKKLFIFLIASLPLCLFAQVKENLVVYSTSDVKAFSEYVLSAIPQTPGFVKAEDTTTAHSITRFYYINGNKTQLTFVKGPSGKYYQFSELNGEQAYLLNFWAKYIDSSADFSKIIAAGSAPVQKISTPRGTMVMSFARHGNLWAIRGKIF
jgi:hypothetical protein